MNVTSGYIIGPSSGTRSVANGTTSPILRCLRMLNLPFVSPLPNLVLIDADAYGSDDPGPPLGLDADVILRLLRRAGGWLHAEPDEILLRFRRPHEIGKRLVEPQHDRFWHAGRTDHHLPGVGLV